MKKLFRKKDDEIFQDPNADKEEMDFEVSNTPITKYKTRRKMMT